MPASANALTQNVSVSPYTTTGFTYSNPTSVPVIATVLAIGI
jgi:hypothetical protein